MLSKLISSQIRIHLLKKFFLQTDNVSYLRELEREFQHSSSGSIRLELISLEKKGLILSFYKKNKKYYRANIEYPFFEDIQNILLKEMGLKDLKDELYKIKDISQVYILGDLTNDMNINSIEIAIEGNDSCKIQLENTILHLETFLGRKINYYFFENNGLTQYLYKSKMFKI